MGTLYLHVISIQTQDDPQRDLQLEPHNSAALPRQQLVSHNYSASVTVPTP